MKLISKQLPVTAPSVGRTRRIAIIEYAYEVAIINQLKQSMYLTSRGLKETLLYHKLKNETN